MLTTRFAGLLTVRDGHVVQSIDFQRYLPVCKPQIAVEYLNRWGVDEIVILDVGASLLGGRPPFEVVRECARFAQVPVAVGGGITSVNDIQQLVRNGADKVVINSAAAADPELIRMGAESFGAQCIMVAVDARRDQDGTCRAFTHSGTRETGRTAREQARIAEEHGAGEILLTSIDRDGRKNGYDLELLREIVGSVGIPVVACGGAGHPAHIGAAIDTGVQAVAAGNMLHFTEHSVVTIKRWLARAGYSIRIDSQADYADAAFDASGRVAKVPDEVLERLRFEYHPEEVI